MGSAVESPEKLEKKIPEYMDGLPIGDIVRAIKSIRFGEVRIVLQNSNVVQIDKTEKTRFFSMR